MSSNATDEAMLITIPAKYPCAGSAVAKAAGEFAVIAISEIRMRSTEMAEKLHYFGKNERGDVYCFHCPGCGNAHPFEVPRWTWNGSMDKPTFTPSLLCNADHAPSRCHSFVADGKIQFLSDCHHSLAGQTVEIPDWESQA